MRLSASGGLSLGNSYVGTDAGAGNMDISGTLAVGTTTQVASTVITAAGGISQTTATSCSTGTTTNAAGLFNGCVASDQRLKKNISKLEFDWAKFMDLKPLTYEWIDKDRGEGTHAGFVAQQVQKDYPIAITSGGKGLLAVDPNGINAINTAAIQSLQKEITMVNGVIAYHRCVSWLPVLCADE